MHAIPWHFAELVAQSMSYKVVGQFVSVTLHQMYLRVVLTGTAKDSLFNSFILCRPLQQELYAQTCNSSHVLNQQWEDKKKKRHSEGTILTT